MAMLLWAAKAQATSSLYTSQCTSCHSATVTSCNGCHAHGVHSSSAFSDINVTGTTNKTSYAPGETVTVTIKGGYRNGWVRAVLFDQNLKELARSSCPGGQGDCTTNIFPATVTAAAPTVAGSYVWAVGWYGNKYDLAGASFGTGTSTVLKIGYYTADAAQSNHGYQVVGLLPFTVTGAAAPAIALSPTSLAFSSVAVGSSQALTTQVQNTTGTAPLNVTGITRCAGTPTSVTWTPTAAFTVAAGLSTALNVTFAPTVTGALPAGACLSIASNDPAKPTITLGLTGTGTPLPTPAIALNPSSLAFPSVTVGSSQALTSQVQNLGNAPLNVTGITRCAGTPTSITWTPAAAFTVAAGLSTGLYVTFAPTTAGALPAGACLSIASNDPAKPTISLGLTGTGTAAPAPALALNPTSLAFTSAVGSSQTLTTQVQNTGNAPLNVTGITPCAGTPTSIAWTPTAAFTVAAGMSASLNVKFAPTATGALPAGACLSIASNDPAKPTTTLGLTGTGTAAAGPAIALNPTSLNFATVTVGSSKMLAAQVQNTGTAPLNVTAVSACAGTPASITWTPNSLTVAAGLSASLNVTFVPTAAGALPAGACLSIASNDLAQPTITLGLSGTAAAPIPAIALNPASLAFASVAVGSSLTLTSQVQSTGTSPLNVTGITRCAGTPTSVTWTPTAAFTVAAGLSTGLNVTFAPTATGALPAGACLSIASNDPAKPTISLGLTGTGTPAPTPAIALNPSSLAFPSVTVGSSQTLTSQVQDLGNAPLNVTGITRCPGTPTSITWTPTAVFTVAAGVSTGLNVTFAPITAGALPAGACLSIASNDPVQPTISLGLTGTGTAAPAPALALSPASFDFQTVVVGGSQTLTTQVQNTGTASLNVTGITRCAGTPTSITWTPTAAFTVSAGMSAGLNVKFAPTATGALPAGACLSMASNDPAKPAFTLGLAGTGTPAGPAIAINPASLDFQTVTVGASKTLAAQVQNAGNAPLNVTGITRCAGTPTSISWTPAAPFTVAAAGVVTALGVTFAPTAEGALPAGACLSITSDDPAKRTVSVGLAGTATATSVPAITLDPGTLDFQTIAVGNSGTLTAKLHNSGNAKLEVTSIGRCSGTPATVAWSAAVPISVAPGGSTTVTVLYVPAADGALPAGSCLEIGTNDPARSTVSLAILGAGSMTGVSDNPPAWGCSTGGSAGGLLGLLAFLLVAAGRRRAGPTPQRFSRRLLGL